MWSCAISLCEAQAPATPPAKRDVDTVIFINNLFSREMIYWLCGYGDVLLSMTAKFRLPGRGGRIKMGEERGNARLSKFECTLKNIRWLKSIRSPPLRSPSMAPMVMCSFSTLTSFIQSITQPINWLGQPAWAICTTQLRWWTVAGAFSYDCWDELSSPSYEKVMTAVVIFFNDVMLATGGRSKAL